MAMELTTPGGVAECRKRKNLKTKVAVRMPTAIKPPRRGGTSGRMLHFDGG